MPSEASSRDTRRSLYSGVLPILPETASVRSRAELLAGGGSADLAGAIASLVDSERCQTQPRSASQGRGFETRRPWEAIWDLQRREDAGEKHAIPSRSAQVRPKGLSEPNFFRLRGKLDVPHERFISYPGAEREGEGMLIGWAGWDHLQRAQALAGLYNERRHQDGWGADKLTPLLAGLWELVPWLKQWHNEPSADHGGERLGDYFEGYVQAEARSLGLTVDDLRAWRPAEKTRRGPRKKKAEKDVTTE